VIFIYLFSIKLSLFHDPSWDFVGLSQVNSHFFISHFNNELVENLAL
jgi:hypothetical protein